MADHDMSGLTPAPAVDETSAPPPPVARRTPGKAIAALVCGVLSLIIAGVVLGVVAIVLGSLARKEISTDPQGLSGAGMALAGMITGAIGLVLAVLLLALGGPAFIG